MITELKLCSLNERTQDYMHEQGKVDSRIPKTALNYKPKVGRLGYSDTMKHRRTRLFNEPLL
jgi:hypothetical protein